MPICSSLNQPDLLNLLEIALDPLSEVKPYPIPGSAKLDSTTLIRSHLGLSGRRLGPKSLKSAQQTSHPVVGGFEAWAHIRSYVTPWAAPIFHFRSGVELLGIIADALTGSPQLFFLRQVDH